MLAALSIRDIVLIDKLDMSMAAGLCVLTGETGAGKSILLDALGLALGGRADAGLVAHGAEQGSVTAVFDVPLSHPVWTFLCENGLDANGELILRRVQTADGRTKAFINDQPVSVGLLRQVGDFLVEIHGQHDERGLLDSSGHRDLLDAYAGGEKLAQSVAGAWAARSAASQALAARRDAMARAESERAYLTQMVEELDELDPQPGEEDELAQQRTLMMHAEKIAGDLQEAEAAIAGDMGMEARLSLALRKIERAKVHAGAHLDRVTEALERALVEAAEAREQVAHALGNLEFDPVRLEETERRLFALRAAARKHKVEVDQLPALRARMQEALSDIETASEQIDRLEREVAAAERAYFDVAHRLSDVRSAAARQLDEAIAAELAPLKLDKATFHTRVVRLADDMAGPGGVDQVEFLVSTNPGAPLAPLIKIASGGELSRFVLALKVALAAKGSAPTLIFDEVDSGVGGAVAEAVGQRLAALARNGQVLVVTHSPQVAARGAQHLRIAKRETGRARNVRMATSVDLLDEPARREEIARMLSGAQVTDEARAAADRLIRSDS